MAKYIEDNSNILILDTIPKKNIILYISNYSNEQNYKIDIYDVKHLSMNYSKDITQNNKKYDLLFIWRNNIKKNNKEIAFKIKLTNIILALNKQAINGTLIMFIKNSSIRSSNIYMLSKYYKCITLYNGLYKTGQYIIVICKQFIGINIKELDYLNNLLHTILNTNDIIRFKINNINKTFLYNYKQFIYKNIKYYNNNLVLFQKILALSTQNIDIKKINNLFNLYFNTKKMLLNLYD